MKRKKRGGLYKQPAARIGLPTTSTDPASAGGVPRAARTRRTPSGYVPPGWSKLAGASGRACRSGDL